MGPEIYQLWLIDEADVIRPGDPTVEIIFSPLK
jgi:hypothetical protein